MPVLQIFTVSTRPQRVGPSIAAWFVEYSRAHGAFEIEPIDLAEVGLPLFDEPEHPRLRKYHHAHTKAWSASVARADAFVFVTPEYNHATPPSLVNALDYLVHEWAYKPVGFVSYGGAAGGARSVEAVTPQLTALKMMPLFEAVLIPFFPRFLDSGVFRAERRNRILGRDDAERACALDAGSRNPQVMTGSSSSMGDI